jgi:DNA-binding response OmpR family regulator
MADTPRILLVDDEENLVRLIEARLRHAGYDVLIARDGAAGLEMARTQQPAVIILDLMLPKLNGYEVCTMLKQDTRYQNIPIMLLTAKGMERDKQLGLECGADAYVQKPFKPQEFLEQVRRLTNAAHRSGETPA